MIPWLLAAGAVVGGMNALNKGNAEIAQWEGRERAQRFNAAVRRSQAQSVNESYGQREEQVRRQARMRLGTTNAWLGQSGTGQGGSNADVAAQNQVFAELDALNVRYEGALIHDNLMREALGEDMAADVSHDQAHYASRGKTLGFVGSFLGAGAQSYGYAGGGSTSYGSVAQTSGGMPMQGSFGGGAAVA